MIFLHTFGLKSTGFVIKLETESRKSTIFDKYII